MKSKAVILKNLFCILKKIQQNDGKMKYTFLVCLFKLILSLSHGNSAAKNGFSINRLLLEIHGSSLKKETIEAIRIVTVFSNESVLDIPATKEMISMVSTSRQLCMEHLEQKRKEEEKAKEEATLVIDKNES